MMHLPVVLNSDLTEAKRVSPVSLSLTLNMTPLSTASMTLSEGEEILPRSYVELFTAKGSAGIFRAREPEVSYGETQTTVELEHAICEVGDSLVTEKIEEEMQLDVAISRLFSHYKGTAWQLIPVTFTDTVVVDVDRLNVLEGIIGLLEQVPQYYMYFDFSTTPWSFGIAEVDMQVTAEGRLSRNVISGSISNDDSSLCTRVYVAYKGDDDEEETWISIEDADAITRYGLVERKIDDTYTTVEKARSKAEEYLRANNRPRFSISISGVELSDITGESLDNFEIGKRFRFVFDPTVDPVDEIIKSIQYSDLVQNDHAVSISMNEEEDLEYVLSETKKNSKTTRNNKKALDNLHYEFYSEDGYFRSMLDMNEYRLRTVFEDTTNSLRGELEQTASYLRSTYTDGINQLRGEVEQTASHLRSTFEDGQNSLRSVVEQTASYWRSTLEDTANSLRGVVEQTASYWRSTYEDGMNSLRGEVEQTASYWRSTYEDGMNSLRGVVEQTASYWRSTYENGFNSLRTVVEQTDSGWRTALEGVVDANGKVTAASIATQINSQGQAGVKISGAWVKIDGSTTINDVLSISDNGINISKKIRVSGDVMAETITLRHGQNASTLTEADFERIIVKAQVTGNTLYLWKNGDDVTATSGASINFSKAVASMGWSWSNGTLTVTPSPQNTDFVIGTLAKGTVTYSAGTYTIPVNLEYGSGANTYTESTGKSFTLSPSVTAGTSTITWDGTNNYFYNYGYAYMGGGSSPVATSEKRTSSTFSIGDDSWSNGTKKVWVKHGTSEILSDTVSLPAVSDTYWENTTGNTWRTRITIGGAYRYSSTKTFTPNYYNDDSFDTTAAGTSVQVNGHYNNSDGYYISSNSRNADVQINVKGTWTHGGGSETHYSWIEGAAGRLYRRGYDNGASGGASHEITSFDTTAASTSETYNNLTNNSDGYVISGTGPNANAFIVTKSTWKCDGESKSKLSYLQGAPTSLYNEAFMRGWANYYDDPDWWEEPSSSNGNKCYIPNRSRTGKTLWFTASSSGSNYTSLGSGWYYTVTPLSNGKYKHSFVLEMSSNSYKGLKNETNYTLYK